MAALLFLAGCGDNTVVTAKTSPNIVLVVIDALRADKLGAYGFPGNISPELDAMARQGVLFENVISQSSWTRPSIGSLLTSLYPRSIGIYKEKYDILPDKYETLAEILKANGYRTFGITANPNINKIFNFHQGFDEYRDSSVVWKWMTPRDGQEIGDGDNHLPGSREIFQAVLENARENAGENRPVYVQINVMDVHSPYLARDEYKNVFSDYPVKKVNFDYSASKLNRLVRGTLGAVRQVSSDTGEFVEELRNIPGWQNTLFVITSDHGQGLDDHPDVPGSPPHGNLVYESQVRVPLIFYHPGKPLNFHIKYKPHQVKNRVRLLDVMPTILDYAGIAMPRGNNIHGLSLIDLIAGAGKQPRLPDFFVVETNWRKIDKIALYGSEWKYIENRDNWKGVNKRELQPMGLAENGTLTDKIKQQEKLAKKMKQRLYLWEKKYKRTGAAINTGKLSKKEIQQLKSLGYLQ
jgi:arylsulfatase A-like enzyme